MLAAALSCLAAVVACGGAEELALNPVGIGGAATNGHVADTGGDAPAPDEPSSAGSSVASGGTTPISDGGEAGEGSDGEAGDACSGDADCVSEDAPRCSATATCVECLSDADCSQEKPFCDTQTGSCLTCSGADCLESACDSEPGAAAGAKP